MKKRAQRRVSREEAKEILARTRRARANLLIEVSKVYGGNNAHCYFPSIPNVEDMSLAKLRSCAIAGTPFQPVARRFGFETVGEVMGRLGLTKTDVEFIAGSRVQGPSVLGKDMGGHLRHLAQLPLKERLQIFYQRVLYGLGEIGKGVMQQWT